MVVAMPLRLLQVFHDISAELHTDVSVNIQFIREFFAIKLSLLHRCISIPLAALGMILDGRRLVKCMR